MDSFVLFLTASDPPVRSLPTPPPLVSRLTTHYKQMSLHLPPLPVTLTVSIIDDHVSRQLVRLHLGKTAVPDGVSPRVFKACALQLCGVLNHDFNMSLSLQTVL